MVLCHDGVKTVGCMWVNNRESRFGGTIGSYRTWDTIIFLLFGLSEGTPFVISSFLNIFYRYQ